MKKVNIRYIFVFSEVEIGKDRAGGSGDRKMERER